MKRGAWKKKIVQACQDAGTYRPYFEDVINALAEILEKRDEVEKKYKESGSRPVAMYTNKGGNKNIVKSPYLILWMDLNRDALTYWRDLGLTPSGLKKISDDSMKPVKRSMLAEALKNVEV